MMGGPLDRLVIDFTTLRCLDTTVVSPPANECPSPSRMHGAVMLQMLTQQGCLSLLHIPSDADQGYNDCHSASAPLS